MNVFTFFIVLSLGNAIFLHPRTSKHGRKYFCICECILLTLIAGFRGAYTSDMVRYSINFVRVIHESWGMVFQEEYHVGLYIFVKLISYVSSDRQFIFAALGFVFAGSFSFLIYKNSKDPLLSYVLLVPMGYFGFTLTGIAQGLAISLCLMGYYFLLNKKYVAYGVVTALAISCHTSAIVTLIGLLLSKVKINRNNIIILALFYVFVYVNKYQIGSFLIEKIAYRDYIVKITNGGLAELCIYLAVVITATICFQRKLFSDEKLKFYYLSCVTGAIFFTFVPVMTEFFRIAMYFNILITLMIPAIVNYFSNNDLNQGRVLRMMVYVILFVMYFGFTYGSSSMNLYSVYWK